MRIADDGPGGGLDVRGLAAQAGSFSLGPVDLWVTAGQVLVVLGPSGSGKTVLLETIAGLRPQRSGAIWLDGTELASLPPERRGVGLVFQDAALFPHLSVRENVRFGPRVAGETADALLRRFRIDHLADRLPRSLSGGERQRVALARALAIDPRLLLLDEPLSALDQPTREDMRVLLQEVLAHTEIPAVHVTHDREEALSIGDDLAIVVGGRVRQAGPAGQVMSAPADADVARLLGWSPLGPGIAERGTVRAGTFTFPAAVADDITGPVRVFYRPEEILFSAGSGDAPRSAEASIVTTTIATIVPTRPLARVCLASDPPLTALVLHRDLDPLRARPGDHVTAVLPPGSVRVFPEE